jgi:hypothetical protein
MIISFLIILTVLLLVIPTIYSFAIGAPILYSPKKATREALKTINPKEDAKFFDLGMGSGRTLIVASKEFKLKTFGYELSPIVFFLAKINILLSGIKKPQLFMKNFYKQNLSEADIVFCFLTPPAMEKLKPKFEMELKAGTFIISYAFKIPSWKEKYVLENCHPGNVYIYEKI